jgi:hypothetical protein
VSRARFPERLDWICEDNPVHAIVFIDEPRP